MSPDLQRPDSSPTPRSRVVEVGAPIATAALALVLIDGSPETTLRHSPIQLVVIGGAVLCFIALTALWRQTSWATKAQLATLFLLAIACATCWLPGGMNNGMAVAGKETSFMLVVISCLGVLAAGGCLLSLPLPWWLKLAAIPVTAYGTAAFLLALVNRSTYSSVFNGDSFWMKAPRWAQGSFLGIALISLSIVATIVVAVFKRHEYHVCGWRWKANLAIAIVVGIGVAGFLGPDARTQSLDLSPVASHGAKQNPSSNHDNQGEGINAHGGVKATNFDLATEDNGGVVESITGDDVFGKSLIDGNVESVCWVHPPLNGPVDIVISFYNRQPALLSGIAVTVPDPLGPEAQKIGPHLVSVPKDVEVWVTIKGPDSEYQKVGSGTITAAPSTQTIQLPGIEARFLKLRVLSVQREPFEAMAVGISGIQVFEATANGYRTLRDRNPDLANWKGSPRYAAQRGIGWLQPATVRWQKDKKCFGCHIQAQSVMGFTIAKKNNYAVNENIIKELSDFTEKQQNADGSYLREPEPSTQFAAMGLSYYDDAESIQRNPVLLKTVNWLLDKQKDTGDMPYGVLGCQGDAVVQGPVMATANSLLAFKRAYTETNDPRYRQAAERALAWIESAQPISTQDEVLKVLALAKFGGAEQKSAIQSLVERLITEQRPSGGWRECPDHADLQEPNPFSTGQVLYAFKQAGVSISSSPFIKGVKYLMDVQQADGSWKVDGHVLHGQGAPYAPSMWAIIGLAGSFGTIQTGSLQIAADLPAASSRNLEIILDASGSMKLALGKSTRIATARQVLRDVLAGIPDDMNVGLRVYADRFSSRDKQTCTDTQLKVPIQKLDRQQIVSVVDNLKPRGETPLVYSILQSPADLKAVGGGSVIVITDGEETCHGDAVSAAQQLKAAGIPITLNIVGFTLKGEEKEDVERLMRPLAEATGGQFYSAQDGESLSRALRLAALNKFPYEVFNAKGEQVAKGQAGPLSEELQPGTYKVVVRAGDQELTDTATVTLGGNTELKVVRRGQQLVIERGTDDTENAPQTRASSKGQS